MSELQQQLEFLKSVFPKSTTRIIDGGKGRESFLFDPTKAAELSVSDLYSMALDGLHDLLQLDSRFRAFQETLFAQRAINENREMQSKQVILPCCHFLFYHHFFCSCDLMNPPPPPPFDSSHIFRLTLCFTLCGFNTQFNNKLDKRLGSFMRLLSPYFLMKAAHKTLEFLIRRYKLRNIYVSVTMQCIIIYNTVVY